MDGQIQQQTDQDDMRTVDEVQQQLNLIERVKAAADVSDDFLAAVIANQVEMARIERRENELLRVLKEGIIQVDIGQIDIGETVLAAGVEEGMEEAFTGEVVPFPFEGGSHAFPRAPSEDPVVINFQTGEVDIPGIENPDTKTLQTLAGTDQTRGFSGSIFTDTGVEITLLDERRNKKAEANAFSPGFINFSNVPITYMELSSPVPFLAGGFISTALQNPINPEIYSFFLQKFGALTVPTSFTPIPFIPATDGAPDDYNATGFNSAAQNFGNPVIVLHNAQQNGIIIQNTGATDADVLVEGFDVTGKKVIADPDIHSSTDRTEANAITAPANDTIYVESGAPLDIRQIRAKGAAAPASLEIQYMAQFPGRR